MWSPLVDFATKSNSEVHKTILRLLEMKPGTEQSERAAKSVSDFLEFEILIGVQNESFKTNSAKLDL